MIAPLMSYAKTWLFVIIGMTLVVKLVYRIAFMS